MSTVPMATPLFPANSLPKSSTPNPLLSLLPYKSPASLQSLRQLHALAIKTQLQHHPRFLTSLLNSLTHSPTPSSLEYAHQLFDQIPDPNTVLFNTLARGYSRSPDSPHLAFSLFSQMLSAGLPPDPHTFPSLLKALAASKALAEGRQAHAAALKLAAADNPFVLPTLINMYAECGDLRAAISSFAASDRMCIVSYNSMIAAFVRGSRPSQALALFRELQSRGIEPTYVTVLGVLAACALLGALELGRWIHEYVKKNKFDSHVKVNTALIDMYAKCGSLEDAVDVFREMGSKDTQAWSAMIVAYAVHGHGDIAVNLFEEMKRGGIKPDGITFLGVLYACSHSGMVEEGLGYYHGMKSENGVVLGIKHYGCMVDLLARAGRLNEAFEFIDTLPMKPTPVLWRTLLSACGGHGHGNVELGKRVFEKILELDDSHGGDFVILSNMCAAEERWDEVDSIRKLMSERGAVKVPGCSSIEVDSTVHEFFSGDGKHPRSREVHQAVDDVMEKLREAGYVPDTSRVFHKDMEEEEKEVSLKYHSEKLAIAFGLINSGPGDTIRVVKNLRVCGDCHSMAKMASLVFDREIVLRDLNRFHRFKEGSCSCGDYW